MSSLISEGKIKKIGSLITDKNAKIINIKNLHVSTGWFDSSVSFGEPGYEERETLLNGADVASKSGFTDLILNSCTKPVLDNQTDISFIKSKSSNSSCNIHPLGALTISSKSKDLAELIMWSLDNYNDKQPIILSVSEKDEVTIKDVAELIAKEYNYQHMLEFDSSYSDGQYKKTADNSKLIELYGNYNFTNIKDGIKNSVEWFINNYNNCRK